MLIKSVANNLFGAATSLRIFSSVLLPEVFSSSISVGVSEKKADSAAETNETITNNKSIESIEKTIPVDNGLTVMLRSEEWETIERILGADKVMGFG